MTKKTGKDGVKEAISSAVVVQLPRRNKKTPPEANDEEMPCPITALGHLEGKFWFLDTEGQRRCLSDNQLGKRSGVASLLLGDMAWAKQKFKAVDAEGNAKGFNIAQACEHLMGMCRQAGIYGDHVVIRRPGVWLGEGGVPIAHCGDAVFFGGEKLPPGMKMAGHIFAASAREHYPAQKPATTLPARLLQADIEKLWNFRDDGAGVMVIGLVGQGYLAAALSWRANGFLSGGSNAGKSMLLSLMHAMTPISHYTTDTSKAGIEGAVNGKAKPSFIDETAERSDGDGGQRLLDVVLSASSGAGTKGHRGTVDGSVRTIEMVGSVVMASISPPLMQPQHRSRFTIIELLRAEAGADHRVAMEAAIARAEAEGPALFARALAGFDRYKAALAAFREALRVGGCVPREMDHLGAILAGHWLLTEDGVPDEDAAAETVKIIEAFIRGRDEMARDDAPQIVLSMLLSRVVSLDRSTDQESIGGLIGRAISTDFELQTDSHHARKVLGRWGIRAVSDGELPDKNRRPAPRLSEGNGIWIDARVTGLRGIFDGSPFSGDRWVFELMRLPSAKRSTFNVRVGGMPPGKMFWLSWDEINDISDTC